MPRNVARRRADPPPPVIDDDQRIDIDVVPEENEQPRQGCGFQLIGDLICRATPLPSEKIDQDIEAFAEMADMGDWKGVSKYFDSLLSMCQLSSTYQNWRTRFRVAEHLVSCFDGLKEDLDAYVKSFFDAKDGTSEHKINVQLVDTVSMLVVLIEKFTVQLQRYASQTAAAANSVRGKGAKARNPIIDNEIAKWKSANRFRMINCLIALLELDCHSILGYKKRALRYVFAPEMIEVLFMERFLDTVTQLYEDSENANRSNQSWINHFLKIGMILSADFKMQTQFADSLFTKTLQLTFLETANNYPFIEPLVQLLKEEKDKGNVRRSDSLRSVISMVVRRACMLYQEDRAERLPPKSYCMLIQALAVNAQDIMLNDANLVYKLLDNPHQNVRMAGLQALADMFSSPHLSQHNCERFLPRQQKRIAIFYKLVAHTNDEGTNVRSKAVSLLRSLMENRRIPEEFESIGLLTVVGGRLLDKSVQVRKCAIQFLTVFLDNNRHGHDFTRDTHVVLLDEKARDLRLRSQTHSRVLQEAAEYFVRINFQLKGYLKNELIALFKGEVKSKNESLNLRRLFEDLTIRENAAAVTRHYAHLADFPYKENLREAHPDNDLQFVDDAVRHVLINLERDYSNCKIQEMNMDDAQMLEEEQANRDAEHTIMQLRAQLQQLINKMSIESELADCTHNAVRCVMMGDTAEIKEGIKFLTRCKLFGISGADDAIRSMCSLVWRPSADVIEELVEAAEDMFISRLEGNEKAAERDKSTVENLMSAMSGVTEKDRASVEEVIYLLASPEKKKTESDPKTTKTARKKRPIEVNVISRLWTIALDTSIGNEERKMIALRVLYPISRTEKGLLEARARIRSIQKKLAEKSEIAVEALRIISILGTQTEQEKAADAYNHPVFRINQDDSLFKSIEQLFFHEVFKSDDDPKRDWFNIIRLTISTILNVSMDVNVMLPKLAMHFVYRVKKVSEFYYYYEQKVQETRDDDVKREVAKRRYDYWAVTYCRVWEKFMAFCGEVAVQLHAYIQITIPRLHGRYVKKIVNAEKNDLNVNEVQVRYLTDLEKSIAQRKTIFAISEELTEENASNDLHHLVSLMCDKRLFLQTKLLGRLLPVVVYGMRAKTMPEKIRRAAALAFAKFMPLSAEISSFGAPQFFSTMVRSSSDIARCNLVAACCDFAFSQPTLFELYAPSLFRMSSDKSPLVRESTVLVLSHLMSNDMIQTRGILSEPARLICDEDRHVKEAAQSFFRDLNARSETLIQLLPEFVFRFASPSERMPYMKYKLVFEFISALLKEKNKTSTDSMIDRVCMKFANIDMTDTEAPKYLLIALIKFSAHDGGLHRLQDNWRHWSKFLCDVTVAREYRHMIEHLYNQSKSEEYRSQCTELINNINKIQNEGLRREDITPAPSTTKRGRGRKPAAASDSAAGPSNRTPARRRQPARRKKDSEDEEEEEEMEEEEAEDDDQRDSENESD
ncbi:unnamed protein product [Caenorhabditis brenneri]